MNPVALHREKQIQPHHWQAAKWLQAECELRSPHSPAMMVIAQACRVMEFEQPCAGIDPFSLLLKACVKHEPCTASRNNESCPSFKLKGKKTRPGDGCQHCLGDVPTSHAFYVWEQGHTGSEITNAIYPKINPQQMEKTDE